jgi:hypothetical protein
LAAHPAVTSHTGEDSANSLAAAPGFFASRIICQISSD